LLNKPESPNSDANVQLVSYLGGKKTPVKRKTVYGKNMEKVVESREPREEKKRRRTPGKKKIKTPPKKK